MKMRSLRKQQGAEVVEFAIASILLFLILFGIIELSVALFDKATLTNASREGARTGILFRPPDEATGMRDIDAENAAIKQVIQKYAEDYLISLGGVSEMTITIQRVELSGNTVFDAGDEVIVTIDYPYKYLILPGFIGTLGGALDLSSTTVMRAE
jgi:Flp pilus assembly protein TadG